MGFGTQCNQKQKKKTKTLKILSQYWEMKKQTKEKRNIQRGHARQSKGKKAYKQAILFHASPFSGSSWTALVKASNAFSVSLACISSQQ